MKRILIVFSLFFSISFFSQEVKTQKELLVIPNTDLVKDFNLKIGNGYIKPVTVTKTTLTDIGFMFKGTKFQFLENDFLAEEFNFKNNKLIKHRQYSSFTGFKTESTSFYTYNSEGMLDKREFEIKKGQGSQTTTYKYKKGKILEIRDFGTLGNGKKFNTVKNFAQNLNYLSYEINGNTNTYQYKNGLISKVQNLNNKTNKSIITKYSYNKEKYITSITYDKNFTSFQLNNKNLVVKKSNKTYNQYFKYVYDKYGNWIIAYQLSVNDKDYSGNKTKIQLYGKRFSFYLREIKYSNGDVTGGKSPKHKNIKSQLLKVRTELYDELINGKAKIVRKEVNKEIFGLPKTHLIEDFGLKIGAKTITPKQIEEKQYDQRQKRNSQEIITTLERTQYKIFDTKIKQITNNNIVYNGKTTYQEYTYNTNGNLTSYRNRGSSLDTKKEITYSSNGNLEYKTSYNGKVNETKKITKTDEGYTSNGMSKQKFIVQDNLVQKIIYYDYKGNTSNKKLSYNNNNQLIKSDDNIYKVIYTYNTNGNLESQNEISKSNENYTKRMYVYAYDKYGNWIISLSLIDMSIAKGLPSFPNPTLRKITYSNGEVTGTTDIKNVKTELISLRKKIRNLENSTSSQVMTWKKTSKTNFNFYFNNKKTAKITNRYMGNDLLVFDVDDKQLYLFKNYVNAPLNKLKTAKKINIDTKNGYWFKLSKEGGVVVFTNQGEFIKKSSVYKYANNQIDVIFKGENQTKQVVLKNYKNAATNKIFAVLPYNSYNENVITNNISKKKEISSAKCIKGDCENGYGEKEYGDDRLVEGFFENGKPKGPIHILYKKDNASVFSLFNGSYKNLEGFKYTFDGKDLSFYTYPSKNYGFYNDYTTKKTYQLNIENGNIVSKRELKNNNNSKCVVGNCTNGVGIYKYSNDATYLGTFKNSKREGFGTIYFKGGEQYIGEFYNNNYHGLGTFIWSKHKYYIGIYKNGKYEGKGVMYYNKDNYDSGIWRDGQLVGKNKTITSKVNNNSNNKTYSKSFTLNDITEIKKCNEDANCIRNYFYKLYRNNKEKAEINKIMRGYFIDLHKMNPKLAFNTIMGIDSYILNAINVKSLPNEVQADLRKRAQGVADGYKKHMKKQGY